MFEIIDEAREAFNVLVLQLCEYDLEVERFMPVEGGLVEWGDRTRYCEGLLREVEDDPEAWSVIHMIDMPSIGWDGEPSVWLAKHANGMGAVIWSRFGEYRDDECDGELVDVTLYWSYDDAKLALNEAVSRSADHLVTRVAQRVAGAKAEARAVLEAA